MTSSGKINRHLDIEIWNSGNSSVLLKYLLITYAMSETVIHAVITYLKMTYSLSFRNFQLKGEKETQAGISNNVG